MIHEDIRSIAFSSLAACDVNNKEASRRLYLALVLTRLSNSYVQGMNSEKRNENLTESHKISKYANDIGNPYDKRALVPMESKNGMLGTPERHGNN